MVSNKIIIILIIFAILLSAVSIIVTISSVNTKLIPEININKNQVPVQENVKVSLTINKPESSEK